MEQAVLSEPARLDGAAKALRSLAARAREIPSVHPVMSDGSLPIHISITGGNIAHDIGNVEISGDYGFRTMQYAFPHQGLAVRTSGGYEATEPHGDLLGRLEEVARYLHGNEMEVDTTRLVDEVQPADFWNSWKGMQEGATYREEIYPRVADIVLRDIMQRRGDVRITDIFGGDGEFMQRVFDVLAVTGDSRRVQGEVIDANGPSLGRARDRFARLPYGESIDVVSKDLTSGNALPVESADIITAIGGLNRGVITRHQAKEIARQVFASLRPGGKFIVTGYSFCLLNAVDFEEIGFKVENKSVPENFARRKLPLQLYVMSKK